MTNLLDLPLDQFRGYLAEGNYPQARQDELMRAYRAKNSLSGLLDRYGEEGLEGKNVSTFFPVAGPGGMSIFDALKSGQLQTRFKDYASDALGGVLGALENPKASYDGTLPQADYDGAAMGTGGLAMGGGGVVAGRLPDGAVAANRLIGGGMSDPTQTGWTFKDVNRPQFSGAENREIQKRFDKLNIREAELPIRSMYATQPNVNPDFSTTTSSQDYLPTVVKRGGEYFVRDGHHRLTKAAEAGNQNAKVQIIDLDNTDTSTPLLDYKPPRQMTEAELAEIDRFLAILDDGTVNANASESAGLLAMNQAPMIAHHNTSLAGLKVARDIGGIPMPSIAISNAKTPVENFGDISLLMRPDQIDPKSDVNVFPADGYTGRQPKGFFDFTNESAAREALRNDPDFGHFGSSWIDSTNGFSDANYMMQVAQFGRDRGIGNPKDFKEIRDYNSFVQKQVYKFGDETDQTAYSQVGDKDGLTAYGETQMLINPKEPYTPSGQRRDPKPYTLDEAYKRMRQNKANQAGSESHSGPGLLRAVSSKQFKSLDEIKKNRGLLKPDDNDMADVKGGWDTFSYDAINDLARDHFDGRHRVAEDYVTDLASGKSVSWAEATPEARTAAQGTIKALREEAKGMPTEYFEAKPKSVQTLGDFDTALVPAGNQEAIDILRRQGVKNIQEYGDQKTRAQLMQEQENLLFANASKSAGLLAASLPEPRNAGEAMAQRILEMRAAGKAGDVTDEMMAQADPQYMFNNTPLDMSEAARMARAEDAGFDVDLPLYHGTPASDLSYFDAEKFGAYGDPGLRGLGVYSTDNPLLAKSYADRPRFDHSIKTESVLKPARVPEEELSRGIIPLLSRAQNRADILNLPLMDRAKLSGISGSAYNERLPQNDGVKYTYTSKDPSSEFVDFNPANIRSRFARFDPEFSHLSNLSAANASAPVGLLAAQPSTEDELRQYLMQRGLLQ